MTSEKETRPISILATKELQDFAKLLLENNMTLFTKVYSLTKEHTYFYYSKNNSIGYAQQEYFGGIGISSVHKPCKNYGCGFKITDRFQGLINPTVEDAESGFVIAPGWVGVADVPKRLSEIRKFKSVDEFINSDTIGKTVFLTLE